MDKASEKTSETDIGRITIPGKWRSWWQGPFKIIAKKTDNLYEIEVKGKPLLANVNRLTPHDCWSDSVEDTNTISWLDGPLSHINNKPNFIPQTKGPTKTIKVGTMVAWPQEPSPTAKSPFGIGKVISTKTDEATGRELLVCQWYGNTRDRIYSTYRPCWYQKSTKQVYFSATRHHASHPADTTSDYGVEIFSDSIAIQDFEIGDDDRLSANDLKTISEHELIKPNWPC